MGSRCFVGRVPVGVALLPRANDLVLELGVRELVLVLVEVRGLEVAAAARICARAFVEESLTPGMVLHL